MMLTNRFHSFNPLILAAAGFGALACSALAVPALPNINTNNIITVTNSPYNAKGDNSTDNTLAISDAIVAASAGGNVGGLFGGTVRIPAPGTFLCGPLTLKNNVNLQIDTNATLKMLPLNLFTNYPAQNLTYPDLIYASSATNLEISGWGAIDGQGVQWWTNSTVSGSRPYMIFFNGNCKRVLIQNVTIQNPPKMHIVFKGSDNDITIQDMTINTTAFNAANTDGIDLVGTNCLVNHCTINAGDDNIALGSSTASAISRDILITNCTFGVGHGVSIGSNTAGAVSNLTVIHCTFNGTDYGIRMKSNDSTGGSGNGGIAQNLNYYDIGMTNIVDGAIVIYSYYDSNAGGQFGTPTSVSPHFAATQAVTTATVPVWRNITISNVNATVAPGGVPGIIWARMEVPASNILLSHVNITASKSFDVYSARGFQLADSKIMVTNNNNPTFQLFNAQLIVTNSVFTTNPITLDGLTTNGFGNSLALYNALASLVYTNALDDGPLTLADSLFTVSNNLMLFPGTVLNYTLDANTNRVAVVGNLALGGTVNLTNGPGFSAGTNILLTYTGNLSGMPPTIGATPTGFDYTYNWDISTPGQVKLVVASPAPPAPTNLTAIGTNLLILLKWNTVSGATSYNLRRGTDNGGPYPTVYGGLVATNYTDVAVTNGVTYYYVVAAVAGGESTNSLQASAVPLPSAIPTNIVVHVSNGQLQLSWPQDHQGWHLQIQTNNASAGLGTNWVDFPGATATNLIYLPIDPNNNAVFLRMSDQ